MFSTPRTATAQGAAADASTETSQLDEPTEGAAESTDAVAEVPAHEGTQEDTASATPTPEEARFAAELLAWEAEKEPPPDGPAGEFGRARTWAFSSDAAVLFQRATQNQVSGAVTTITLSPATDFFVVDNFSVGGFVGVTYAKTGENSATRLAIGPRVGYNVSFSKRASVWPKIGFSYARTSSSVLADVSDDVAMREVNQNAVALNFFVPVMFHPVTNFFLGFGPFLDSDMNGDRRAHIWGGKLTLGGWL